MFLRVPLVKAEPKEWRLVNIKALSSTFTKGKWGKWLRRIFSQTFVSLFRQTQTLYLTKSHASTSLRRIFWTPNYFKLREVTAERIVLKVHCLTHLTDTAEELQKNERRQLLNKRWETFQLLACIKWNAIGRSLLTKTNVKWRIFRQVKRRLDWKLMKSKHNVTHLVSKLSAFFQELPAFNFFKFFWSVS